MLKKTKSRMTTADSHREGDVDDPFYIPPFCVITQEERAEAWRRNPPKPYTLVDPKRERPADVIAFEAAKKERENVRLRNLSKRPPAEKIDFNKMRWDSRRNKFVPIFATGGVPSGPSIQVGDSVLIINRGKRRLAVVTGKYESNATEDELCALAKRHKVWDDKYAKLTPGLRAMTIKNRLKALERKGTEIKW